MKTYYSWEIRSGNVAVKTLDKSSFQHHGTGIPFQIRDYFGINEMERGSKKDITLIYRHIPFKGRVELGPLREHRGREVKEEARLFWNSDLEKIIRKIYPIHFDLFSDDVKLKKDMRPLMRYEKARNRKDTYYVSFIDPINGFEDQNLSWKDAIMMYLKEIPNTKFTLEDVYYYEDELTHFPHPSFKK